MAVRLSREERAIYVMEMMFVRTFAAAAALGLAGCAVELDLDRGPVLEDLFGGDPFEVSDEALEAMPDRFVILAGPDEASVNANRICGWLEARLQRSCDVVRSSGDRLDFQRAAVTPGMMVMAAPEAADDFPRLRAVRWRDVNGYVLFTRRAPDPVLTDRDLRGSRLAATDRALGFAEALIVAADLAESDFETLIGLGELDEDSNPQLLYGNLCEGVFDAVATRQPVSRLDYALDYNEDAYCPLDITIITDETLARLLESRPELDRRPIDDEVLFRLGLDGGRYRVIVDARDLLYGDLMPPVAEEAFRRALVEPLRNEWRNEGVRRFRDARAGVNDD